MASRASYTPCQSPLGLPPPTPQHHPHAYLSSTIINPNKKMPVHSVDQATSHLSHHHHHHHHHLPAVLNSSLPYSSSSLSHKQPSRSNTNSPALPANLFDRNSIVRSVSPQLTAQVMNNLIEQEVTELVKNLQEKGVTVSQHLITLCKQGEWDNVFNLLNHTDKSKFDTKITSAGTNWTPIMFASKENRVKVVDKLIEYGFDVNAQANDGTTALHLACAHSREDMLRCLLVNKADTTIYAGSKNQLPIHILASKNTQTAINGVQLVLKSSPKDIVLYKDGDGRIPLFIALEVGAIKIAKELLAYETKEQIQAKCPPNDDTVLHLLTRKRDFETFMLMYEYGANINAVNNKGQTVLHIISEAGQEPIVRMFHLLGARVDIRDKNDKTPLTLATENGYYKIVDFFIDKYKASIHTRTKDGDTLMHIAMRASESAPAQMAMIFMKKGIPLHMSNKKGAKAIHMAAHAGLADVIRTIMMKGEQVDVRTNDGYTPLHIATENSRPDCVELLLGYGANVSLTTSTMGENPLHVAARVSDGKVSADLLLKSGANVNSTTEHTRETPLQIACRSGYISTVGLLLEEGALTEIQNSKGENALHVSVFTCHYQIAQKLIQHVLATKDREACEKLVNQINNMGESSVHYAAKITADMVHYSNEDRDIMRLLVSYGGDVILGTLENQETPVHYCSKSGNTNVLQEIIGQLQSIDAQMACNKAAKNGQTPLLYACYYGMPEIITLLLKQNARVDVFDERGRAGLHLAAELGHESVMELLLDHNAFVNVRNKSGMTPLHLAAKFGYNRMVRRLVTEYGALIDAMTLNKQTPLHLAAESGQLEVAKTLLSLKADINALDNQAQTPLHLASNMDHAQVVKLFLHAKPELVSVPNKNGYTCGHIAASKGSVAVLKELMKFNQEVVRTARIKKTGSTSLHLAAVGGHVKVVRLLLNTGAKAADENIEGMTALHLAAREGHVRVIQALKNALDWKICSRKNGLTALHVAAQCGQLDCVSELLTQIPAGIKSERPLQDPKGDYEITPLHMACANGHESVVRLLMNSPGVQVDAPTKVNETIPMHLAAQGGHMLVAGLLISRSSECVLKADKQGRTCLHFASAYGHRDMVSMLLGQSAAVNATDKKSWTPLHYASRYGYLDVVTLLVESGADPTASSKDDKIPLSCAAKAGHYAVMSYLLSKEHDSHTLLEERDFLLDLMNSAKNTDNKPIREFILVSEAPIYTAVKLARSFEQLASKEKERSKDLKNAQKYCDQVSIDLLSITAQTNNAGALLRAYDSQNTEFLDVLIELERKDVVSQHAVQKYLTEIWLGGLKWSGLRFILLFFSFLLIPLVWVWVSSPFAFNRLHRVPIIKFMSYLAAHIFFIILITYTIVFPQTKLYEYNHLLPLWNEWLLFFWFIGLLVSDLMNPSDRSGLGVIRVCIQTVGFLAIILHLIAFIIFTFLVDLNDEDWSRYRLDTLYGRNQLLAVAMLLSFIEFLNFLTFHPLFGPWGVIIQELISDLMRFLALLSIFLAGFTLHICAIYQPVYEDPNFWNNTIPPLGQEFIVPHKSFEMLFYALFGLVEPDNMPPMHLSPPFSKIIIKIVFGVYMTVTLIVLINLLIAMMSNTYQRIENQSDIEWKFGRAKLIRNMNRTLSTPSPINLIIGIPILFIRKIQSGGDLTFAQQAFGHLTMDDKKASGQWADRRSSKTSKISRISHGTGITNVYGLSLQEAGFEESRPINDVVNWNVIVKRYYSLIGMDSEKEKEKVDINETGEEATAELTAAST